MRESFTYVIVVCQARSFLNPEDILKGDVQESLSRVQMAIDVLTHFKSTYEDRRANLSQYQRNENEVKPWDFSPLLVFVGLDHFMKRLRTIEVSEETFFHVLGHVHIHHVGPGEPTLCFNAKQTQLNKVIMVWRVSRKLQAGEVCMIMALQDRSSSPLAYVHSVFRPYMELF